MRIVVSALVALTVSLSSVPGRAAGSAVDGFIDSAVRCSTAPLLRMGSVLSSLAKVAPKTSGVAVDVARASQAARVELQRAFDAGTRSATEAFAMTPAGAFFFGQLAHDPCFGLAFVTPIVFDARRISAKAKAILARHFEARRTAVARLDALPRFDRATAITPLIDVVRDTVTAAGDRIPFGGLMLTMMMQAIGTPDAAPVSLDPRVNVLLTGSLADADFEALIAFLTGAAGRKLMEHYVGGTSRIVARVADQVRVDLAASLGMPAVAKRLPPKTDAEIEAELKKLGYLK